MFAQDLSNPGVCQVELFRHRLHRVGLCLIVGLPLPKYALANKGVIAVADLLVELGLFAALRLDRLLLPFPDVCPIL